MIKEKLHQLVITETNIVTIQNSSFINKQIEIISITLNKIQQIDRYNKEIKNLIIKS